jgi:hypothetical protein
MAWETVKLKPGVVLELTPTALEAGYAASNNIRFRAGMAEKLGGWTKYISSAVPGAPLHSHAWEDLAGNARFAVGTTSNLCDITNGLLTKVTPQTLTTNPAVSLTTTAGSNVVTVADVSINTITAYDSVFFATPIAIDGIILSGLYQVSAYLSATTYQIIAGSSGVAGVSGGGVVPKFTTTSGNSIVTVTLPAHGLSVGDDIVFAIPTTVGGITISGRYVVLHVTNANTFTISGTAGATSAAGPTSMNGGNAQYVYYITLAPVSLAGSFGTGNYGAGAYGLGAATVPQTGNNITATDWSVDNWGELLVACPQGGGVYYWGPASGYANASIIANAPPFNTGAFVSIAAQQIIAYGSSVEAGIGVYQDPLYLRWCDVGDFTAWSPLATNQAGSYRIPSGSRIVGAIAGPSTTNYVWTDIDLWAMNYIGSQFVYGVTQVAGNCGLIAKHAYARLGTTVYWMGVNSFFSLSGGSVAPLPCAVWDAVFQNINRNYAAACFAGANTGFNEVWFFFPSKTSGGYCDMAAKVNVAEGTWDIVSIQRNTWIDISTLPYPIATTFSGNVYAHETGTDADTAPMNAWFQTSRFSLNEGEDAMAFDRIYPDFKWNSYGGSPSAAMQVTINSYKYPGQIAPSRTYGPYSIAQPIPYISKRGRGKWFDLVISSSDSGSFWRLGAVKFRAAPDGRGVI